MNTPSRVAEIVRQRQTFKVLGDPANPVRYNDGLRSDVDQVVQDCIKKANWAPFHYDRGIDGLAEPWRVDWLGQDTCRRVAVQLPEWFDDVKAGNKLPAMLAACGSLILVSWLPQFIDQADGAEVRLSQRQTDEEHLAATSAFVQNLLLLLTDRGLGTYWSSGGQFREPAMFEQLGIKHGGRLLAAVFVDYSTVLEVPAHQQLERLPGKHRDRRCQECRWLTQL